jgi:hypothetical protein
MDNNDPPLAGSSSRYLTTGQEELAEKLNASCLVIADALVWREVELTPTLIGTELPGIVFNLAVRLGLWIEPGELDDAESVSIGNYDVPTAERDYFVRLLDESLSFLHEELERDPTKTPYEVVNEWREGNHLTWEELYVRLKPFIAEATLRRVCNKEKHYRAKRTTLEPVAKVLHCHWTQLLWPLKHRAR